MDRTLLHFRGYVYKEIESHGNISPFHLAEFCGCSLEKAVSAEEITSGNREHIARVRAEVGVASRHVTASLTGCRAAASSGSAEQG